MCNLSSVVLSESGILICLPHIYIHISSYCESHCNSSEQSVSLRFLVFKCAFFGFVFETTTDGCASPPVNKIVRNGKKKKIPINWLSLKMCKLLLYPESEVLHQ